MKTLNAQQLAFLLDIKKEDARIKMCNAWEKAHNIPKNRIGELKVKRDAKNKIKDPYPNDMLHHSFYTGEDPWDYHNGLLITLCAKCHEDEEDQKEADTMCLTRLLSLMLLRKDINNLFWTILLRINPMDEVPSNKSPKIARERFQEILNQIENNSF